MPALLARFGVERDQVIVRRLHVEIVIPHSETAVADMGPALGLPEVMPKLMAIAGINRPTIVWHGDVQSSVYLEHRPLHRATASRDISRTFASDDHAWLFIAALLGSRSRRNCRIPRACRQLRHPSQGQIFDVGTIDLSKRAVPLAGVVAVVGRPRILEWLEQFLRRHSSPLAEGSDREKEKGKRQQNFLQDHFRVTR